MAANNPLLKALHWLTEHAGFPTCRLAERAEVLLLISTLAGEEAMAQTSSNFLKPDATAQRAALKAHNLRRTQVHYKSDNSAKV